MGLINRFAKAADRILMSVMGIMVFLMLLISGYFLYDTVYTGRNAYISRELLQYKPTEEMKTGSEINGFDDLMIINKDAVAWLTIYDTNINYPVVIGSDNYEYANKDIYGKSSLTGTIYVSADNDRLFRDNYTIIYGHHMDNGGMFGDLEKYYDTEFFESHTDGFLQTMAGDYRLTIFAIMVTDAYDNDIYFSDYNNEEDNVRLWQRIQSDSLYLSDSYRDADFSRVNKLIVLSTCEDATTFGRIVLFADAAPGEGRPGYDDTAGLLTAKGQGKNDDFALLNLICLLLNIYIVVPVMFVRTKYRQIPYASDMSEKLAGESDDISRDMKRFVKKAKTGLILEIVCGVIALCIFIRTESITAPMVLRDDKTFIMILLLLSGYIIDYICFRYRGERPSGRADEGD